MSKVIDTLTIPVNRKGNPLHNVLRRCRPVT